MSVKGGLSFSKMSERPNAKLQITSLMDVLTIILIFLLVNYSDVEQDTELPDFVELPLLLGKESLGGKENSTMAIGKNKIKLNKNTEIQFNSYQKEKDKILEDIHEQFTALIQKASLDDENKFKNENEKEGSIKVVLAIQADKDVPYEMIDDIVMVASNSGITQFEFVGLKKD